MDEQDLRERLLATAVLTPPSPSTIDNDLDRGRRGRRRRRLTIASGSLAVVVLLGTTAVAVGLSTQTSGADRTHQDGFAHAGQPTTPTAQTASTTGRILSWSEVHGAMDPVSGQGGRLAPWMDGVVGLAYTHLDPGHRYLPDPESGYGGAHGVGTGSVGDSYAIGVSLNWTVDDPSQGRIDVWLAPAGVDRLVYCNDFPPCQLVNDPTYGEIRLGGDPTGKDGFEVMATTPGRGGRSGDCEPAWIGAGPGPQPGAAAQSRPGTRARDRPRAGVSDRVTCESPPAPDAPCGAVPRRTKTGS